MLLHCESCGMEFNFVVENETFGFSSDTDHNIYRLNCPNLECLTPFIVRVNLDYNKILSNPEQIGETTMKETKDKDSDNIEKPNTL